MKSAHSDSNARCLQCGKHAVGPEGNASDANAGSIVNCISYRREHRLERRLTGPVRRQVGTVRIRIAVYQHDLNALGSIGMPESRMREPVHARHLLGIEADFLVQGAAQAMK